MERVSPQWLIYGANGYTGQLIARRAVAAGHLPILAGRNESQIAALAKELGCSYRVFPLDRAEVTAEHLDGVALVLHCAGPFAETAETMMQACLLAGAHYLDITGEWSVIERAAQLHERAQQAGIVLMPAVGFDVVPSDGLAAQLAGALPGANKLELAFLTTGGTSSISPGTAATIFSQLGQGNHVRRDGRIQRLPLTWQSTQIQFPSGDRWALLISWGDIASAFYTTGIANIEVYKATPRAQIRTLSRWSWLLPLARLAPIQWLGRKWIKRNLPGPSDSERARGHAEFWGRVTDAQGRSVEATLTTPEGYTLTTLTALEIVERVLASEVQPGFTTSLGRTRTDDPAVNIYR